MARNICCPLVQLSIERSIWLRSEWTPAPSVPQAIEKTATKGRRIEDTMDIGSHHSAIPGHLGLISMLVGRKIKWDVAKEEILGDADATKLLTRPYRPPWMLA